MRCSTRSTRFRSWAAWRPRRPPRCAARPTWATSHTRRRTRRRSRPTGSRFHRRCGWIPRSRPPPRRAGGLTTKENSMREYAPLHLTILEHGARVAEPMPPGRVTMDDPAFSVMTDLREVSAATTRPEETIDAAHAIMIRRGVRLLFVLDDDGTVCGVLPPPHPPRAKPLPLIHARGPSPTPGPVGDIMTPPP